MKLTKNEKSILLLVALVFILLGLVASLYDKVLTACIFCGALVLALAIGVSE